MPTLRRIEISGYRSIKNLTLDLRPVNVLIGANGSGKSTLISFFKMMNEMMGSRLQQYVGSTGRSQSILHFGPKVSPVMNAKLEFEVGNAVDTYYMRLVHAANDTLIFAEETLSFHDIGYPKPKVVSLGAGHQESAIHSTAERGEKTAAVLQRLLSQCRVYHFHDTSATARVRSYSYLGDNRWLMPDAANLAPVLFSYQERSPAVYKRIVSTIRKIFPDFDDFELAPSEINPREIALNWRLRGSEYLFGPHQLSDGTVRAIAIVTLFLQPADSLPDVLILDEPELGLHPHAVEIVAGLMRSTSLTTQIVVATQSQAFLDHFAPQDVIVAEMRNASSEYRHLEPEQLERWLADYSIGELWEKNVLGGGPV